MAEKLAELDKRENKGYRSYEITISGVQLNTQDAGTIYRSSANNYFVDEDMNGKKVQVFFVNEETGVMVWLASKDARDSQGKHGLRIQFYGGQGTINGKLYITVFD